MRPRQLAVHPQTIKRLLRLKREAEADGEYRVATRLHAVVLNAEGRRSGEIASILKAPRSCVAEWLRSFEELGFEGILEGQRTGRPSGLSADEKAELADIIDSGQVAYGFLSGIWDSLMIAKIIEDEFSVIYTPRHVLRILDDLNFSVQRPKRVLAKADPKKQNKWRRYTYPNIKKKRAPKEQH